LLGGYYETGIFLYLPIIKPGACTFNSANFFVINFFQNICSAGNELPKKILPAIHLLKLL